MPLAMEIHWRMKIRLETSEVLRCHRSIKEVFVEFLDVDDFFDPAANVEPNHQPGEL